MRKGGITWNIAGRRGSPALRRGWPTASSAAGAAWARFGRLEQRKLYATCVGVIFPVCLVSAAVYLFRGELSLLAALPYLAGGLVGGWIGGKLYGRVSVKWLKWLFAGFLFYAGVKYLL